MTIFINFFGIVTESIGIYLCAHMIYDVKFKWSSRLVFALLLGLAFTMAINLYKWPSMLAFLNYLLIFWYCKVTFRESMVTTALCVILDAVLTQCIQFMSIIFVTLATYILCAISGIVSDDASYQLYLYVVGGFLCPMFSLAVCIWLFPKFRLGRLRRILAQKDRFIATLILFMCFTILPIFIIEKTMYELNLSYTFLIIAAMILLLFMIFKWSAAQSKSQIVENELAQMKHSQKDYDKLLTDVRLNQHELKNHLTSVYAAHYTHKTYEELVQAQEEHCAKLIEENRYTDLLLLGDKVLTGFLYGKFLEAEERKITVKYKVSAKITESAVPTYQMIEMLGILLDNAFEALQEAEEKQVFFEAAQEDAHYAFRVSNPFRYVSYEEIAGYFQPGESSKGDGRGLGLYHLKRLCEEWSCEIGCRNREEDGRNRVEFQLRIPQKCSD